MFTSSISYASVNNYKTESNYKQSSITATTSDHCPIHVKQAKIWENKGKHIILLSIYLRLLYS